MKSNGIWGAGHSPSATGGSESHVAIPGGNSPAVPIGF